MSKQHGTCEYSNYQQLAGYKNIYTNYPKLRNICKYTKYSYFINSIKQQKLGFISPEKWEDPYETLFYKNSKYTIFCMCTTNKAITNQDANWHRYSDDIKSKLIRIHYSKSKLCSALDEFASSKDCKIFISKVEYSSREKITAHIKTRDNSLEDYIYAMSLKRNQFSFENEIRIFLAFENHDNNLHKDDIYYINDIDYKDLITHIQIGPHYLYKDKILMDDAYNKVQEIEYNILKKDIEKYLKNVEITRTRLYEKSDNGQPLHSK